MPDADDLLDGCEVDMTVDPIPDDDLPYVALSPDGCTETLEAYKELFTPEVA